jgi:hypothetical protein
VLRIPVKVTVYLVGEIDSTARRSPSSSARSRPQKVVTVPSKSADCQYLPGAVVSNLTVSTV